MERTSIDRYSSTKPTTTRLATKRPRTRINTALRSIRQFLAHLFGKQPKAVHRPRRPSRPARNPMAPYTFIPTSFDLSVAVTLAQAMEFTATYPRIPVQQLQPIGQKIQWDVHTLSNGNLVELMNGHEISALYWEANLDPRFSDVPPDVPKRLEKANIPSVTGWDLRDSNSVLLPLSEVTVYLEKALACLGLHSEARSSFITFWLPSFMKHSQIALRFIPQADYSLVVPLHINPKPDIVTRIVMLFKGVTDAEVWPSARRRALDDVLFWVDVVGVDTAATADKELSSVLEWAGMEISSSS